MSSTVYEVAGKLKSIDEQRELFLWKYRDVSRVEVNEMLKVMSVKAQFRHTMTNA